MERVWLATALALLAGCGAPADEPHQTGGAEALEAPATELRDQPTAALDPASACGRAFACCQAYAAAIPNVDEDSACAGPAEAAERDDADARCRVMAEGWREALRLLPDVEPPPECGP